MIRYLCISGLVVPSQEESQLNNHCRLKELTLDKISISGLVVPSQEESQLNNHCRLKELTLDKIPISGLVVPSQEESQLRTLYLGNLVLSHDNLVRLCSTIAFLSSIEALLLIHIPCSNHDGSRDVPTLDIPKQESDSAEKEQTPDIHVLSLSGLCTSHL